MKMECRNCQYFDCRAYGPGGEEHAGKCFVAKPGKWVDAAFYCDKWKEERPEPAAYIVTGIVRDGSVQSERIAVGEAGKLWFREIYNWKPTE